MPVGVCETGGWAGLISHVCLWGKGPVGVSQEAADLRPGHLPSCRRRAPLWDEWAELLWGQKEEPVLGDRPPRAGCVTAEGVRV